MCRLLLACAAAIMPALGLYPCPATADEIKPPRFSEHLIQGGYGYAYGLAVADLDADGDLDLTSSDTKTNESLYWFENTGRGRFQRRYVQKQEPGWFERHAIGDLNGDSKPDVVVVKNLHGHIVWFENSGRPRDRTPWKRHVIATGFMRAYDVALADLDGDGDLDVAASSWIGNSLAWFENPGKAVSRPWTMHLIAEKIAETRTIRIADFNGDGKLDILGTARVGNLTAWYENPGAPAGKKWTAWIIDSRSVHPTHGQAVDMDGDGDCDVVMAIGMAAQPGAADSHRVAWYENVGRPGTGKIWKQHAIGALPSAFEAVAGDIDGDGDLDVAATSWSPAGVLVWFERRTDRSQERWTPHILKQNWPRANQVLLADLDGDGRLDMVASAENGANEVRWWRNEGPAK